MHVAVPTEIRDGEKRVALVPDIINKLIRLGLDVTIQSGAGLHSLNSDAAYEQAGAKVVSGDVLKNADVILSVSPLTAAQIATLKKGAITISFLPITTAQDHQRLRAARAPTLRHCDRQQIENRPEQTRQSGRLGYLDESYRACSSQ